MPDKSIFGKGITKLCNYFTTYQSNVSLSPVEFGLNFRVCTSGGVNHMIKGISKTIHAKFKAFAEIKEATAAYEEYSYEDYSYEDYLADLAKLDRRAHLRVIDGGRSNA